MSSIAAGTTTTTGYVVTSDSTGALVLKTGASATTAVTIDTSQNVGIGTSNPIGVSGYQGITIGGSTGGLIRLQSGASTQNAQIAANTSGFEIECVNTGIPMKFYTGGSERLRLDTSGNLGIGTSSPSAKLDVNSGSAIAVRLTRGGGIVGNLSQQWFDGTNSWYAGVSGSNFFGIAYNSSGGAIDSAALRLDTSGNLGLGVTPSAWSGLTASQVKNGSVTSSGNDAFLNANCFFNGTNWRYIASSFASQFYEDSGTFVWRTAASGTAGNAITFTQAMTLDASGRLIVGATSASGSNQVEIQTGLTNGLWVQTGGTTSASTIADFRNGSNTPVLTLYGNNTSYFSGSVGVGIAAPTTNLDVRGTTSATIRVGSTGSGGSGDEFGNLEFWWADPDAAEVKCKIYAKNVGNVGPGGGGAADLLFATRPAFGALTERARFTSGGDFDLYITPAKDGQVRWTNGGGGAVQAVIYANGNPELIAQTGGSGGVKLTSGATSWVSASDIRNKNIIEPITNAVTKVATLSSVIYSFKDDEQQTRRVGLVAQELLEVLPEAVYVPEKEEELLGVRYTEVIPLLVAAIKEQQAIIQQLQADVAALKGTA